MVTLVGGVAGQPRECFWRRHLEAQDIILLLLAAPRPENVQYDVESHVTNRLSIDSDWLENGIGRSMRLHQRCLCFPSAQLAEQAFLGQCMSLLVDKQYGPEDGELDVATMFCAHAISICQP